MRNSTQINRTELSYKNSLQRFVILRKLYLKELSKDRLDKAKSEARKLEEKFGRIKTQIINRGYNVELKGFKTLKNGQNENYFSDFELRVLNSIGSPFTLVESYYRHTLADQIAKICEKMIFESLRALEGKKFIAKF